MVTGHARSDSNQLTNANWLKLASINLDIPFLVNGQPMTLAAQIVYDVSSQTIRSAGLHLYGPGAPDSQLNYAQPVAAYNTDGSIEFIGNMSFRYTKASERQLVDGDGAAVSLSDGPQAQLIHEPRQPQAYTLYPANILYIRFTIDYKAGRGQGEVQFGGTRGPIYRYRITPRK